jgi:SAM-dependent methyltransferase
MALSRLFLRDIIALKRRGFLEDCRRVVEIGAQQIADRLILSPELDEAARLFGVPKPELTPVGSVLITSDSPPGKLLWQSLGLESRSVDIEGGDICIDLNEGRVPADCCGAFDLVINAGTTEHIANQGNAFSAIHDLVRVGGLMYHQLPAFGDFNHGFFGYQPKFFHRMSEQNDYEDVYFVLRPGANFEFNDDQWGMVDQSQLFALPRSIPRAALTAVLRRKHDRKFSMPTDK